MLGIRSNKYVTTVKTAKESNDRIKSCIDLDIRNTLKALTELIIRICSHVVRSHVLLVHKILERYIAVLLKLDVILERFLN
jgi:hypothetical protein